MATKRHFVVLGLGTFGEALARRLAKNGCRVTGVDLDKPKVDSLKDVLYEAIIADVTQFAALEHLDIGRAEQVFVSLGEGGDMSPSLMAVLHAKELGARRLVVKGLSADHKKILEKMGVERVVFPESEIAVELADRSTWPNVLDYLPIDPDYGLVEMAVPDSLVGKSLQEADLRRKYSIWVTAIKEALTGELNMFPDPTTRLTGDQILMIVGRHEDLKHLREAK
jgi:trk system potassium uptake protein TrkA